MKRAEALALTALRSQRKLIRKVHEVLNRALPPHGPAPRDAMSELYTLMEDSPLSERAFREYQAVLRAVRRPCCIALERYLREGCL